MKILITGAFGNLGLMCVDQALQMGFQVKCFDLDNKNSKKLAANAELRGRHKRRVKYKATSLSNLLRLTANASPFLNN